MTVEIDDRQIKEVLKEIRAEDFEIMIMDSIIWPEKGLEIIKALIKTLPPYLLRNLEEALKEELFV